MKKICALLAVALILSLASCALAETASDIFGTVTTGGYKNAYFGFGLDLPSWSFASKKDLASRNNWTTTSYSQELYNSLDKKETVAFLVAVSDDNKVFLTGQIMKLEGAEQLLSVYDQDQILEWVLEKKQTALNNSGYSGISTQKSTVRTKDQKVPCISSKYTFRGVKCYDTTFAIFKDDY